MGKKIRFYSTCACILLPLLFLCLYARFNLLAFADGEAPYYIWNKEKANTTQDKQYDVIVLGDSTANASYLPAVLSDSCLNLALGGTSPLENYYTLKDWLEHNGSPRVCYVSFSDDHFRRWDIDIFWRRVVYTHRYKPQQELQMFVDAICYHEGRAEFMNQILDIPEFDLGLPNRYMTSIMNARFNQRKEYNLGAMKEIEMREGVYISGWNEYSDDTEISYDSFYVTPLLDTYYRKIIELCRDNEIQVRIIKLPLPKNTVFSAKYRDELYRYYDSLQKEYPEITVDWLNNYEQKYFWDTAHMNYHGSFKLSTEIKEMYPEDFAEDLYSTKRIDALNYYMKQETKVDSLLRWINGKDYTVIVSDGTGEFDAYYHNLVEGESSLKLVENETISINDNNDYLKCFSISGQEGLASIPLFEKAGTFEVHFSDEPIQITAENDLLKVVILDRYNQQQVCSKVFRWDNDQFVLV